MEALGPLLSAVRACRHCPDLPLGPRPIVQISRSARCVIIGQAPGSRVHESGVPWDDASGDHLREWLSVDTRTFYDARRFAFIPMGFCYPGKGKGSRGDLPPRPECAPLWHDRLLRQLPTNAIVVLVGQYAQAHYLGARRKPSLTATVQAFEEYLPRFFPLPHPSWRSKTWMSKNPWFAARVLPGLRQALVDAARA